MDRKNNTFTSRLFLLFTRASLLLRSPLRKRRNFSLRFRTHRLSSAAAPFASASAPLCMANQKLPSSKAPSSRSSFLPREIICLLQGFFSCSSALICSPCSLSISLSVSISVSVSTPQVSLSSSSSSLPLQALNTQTSNVISLETKVKTDYFICMFLLVFFFEN